MIGSITRHIDSVHGNRILTCRALAALGLPKSAGLDRRPILLRQPLVTHELQQCAEALPQKILGNGFSFGHQATCVEYNTPYAIDLPQSLWRPPPAPD